MTGTTTGRRYGVNAGIAIKVPCRAGSTANVTLSGEQTIDGIDVVEDDRVLLKDQTDSIENGVWDVSSGDWRRSPDWNGIADVAEGTVVTVNEGAVNGVTSWRVNTSGTITPGTTPVSIISSLFGQATSDVALSIETCGADSTGATDSTAAIQACINAAQSSGRAVYVPAGDFLISENAANNYCLLLQRGIKFFGDGDQSRLVVDSAVDASTDIIKISADTVTDDVNTHFMLSDFRIKPEAGTPGRHGIQIDIQTRAVYDIEIEHIRIDQLGGRGIVTIPHGTPIVDGYFTSRIQRSTIYGGIYLDKAGDSIRIYHNTITGTNAGVYADLVGVGGSDGGAHGLEIVGNNITCNDGALDVRNAWAGRFENNVVEVPSPGTLHNSAAISIDGDAGNVIRGFVVSRNLISTGTGNDTIFIGRSHGTMVDRNYVSRKAGQHSYKVGANSVNAVIANNTDALDETEATVKDDSGSGTLWYRTWAGAFEFNQNLDMAQNKIIYFRDSADTKQDVVYVDTADDTFHIGFSSTVPSSNEGIMIMHCNGSEMARISPVGTFQINGLNPVVSPEPYALLQCDSTSKGIIPPRMTTTDRTNISNPGAGVMVFDTTLNKLSVFGSSAWETVTSVST